MPAKNILRTLIGLQVAVWIGQWVAAEVSTGKLIEWYGLQFRYVIDPVTVLFGRAAGLALFVALLAALLIASFGLLNFSGVSRTAYLIVNIVAIVLGLLHGPLVRSGSMDFFHSANILLTGVILTMVYSPPFKWMYEGRGIGPPPVMMAQAPAPAQHAAVPPSAPAWAPPVPAQRSGVSSCGACDAATQGAKFCPQCGKPVVMKKVCSRCGVEAALGEKFCRQCGNPTP